MEFRKKDYAPFDIFDSEWAVITVKRQSRLFYVKNFVSNSLTRTVLYRK